MDSSATAQMMELQQQLGFTGQDVDGKRGPKTNTAILKAADEGRLTITPPLVVITQVEPSDALPARAIEKLKGVHNALFAVVIEAATRSDVPFTVIEGLRSAARQKRLVSTVIYLCCLAVFLSTRGLVSANFGRAACILATLIAAFVPVAAMAASIGTIANPLIDTVQS